MDDLSKLRRPDGVYIIYSMDATCTDEWIDNAGPLNPHRYWKRRMPIPEWIETEGNEQYDFGYLGKPSETGDTKYMSAEDAEYQNVPDEALDLPIGYGFEFSIDGADYYMKIGTAPYYEETWLRVTGEQVWKADGFIDREEWEVEVEVLDEVDAPARPEGRHRKWVAMLNFEQWLDFADNYCIELHPNGMPIEYNDTMGSLTEFGLLPAIAISNTEGWDSFMGDPVIMSDFYCSFYGGPWDHNNERGAMAWDARENSKGAANMLNAIFGAEVMSA